MRKLKRSVSTDEYWRDLERNERRAANFNKEINTPCFKIVMLITGIFLCPCICYEKCVKVHPFNE